MPNIQEIRKKVRGFQKKIQTNRSLGEVFASPKLTYFIALFTIVSVLFFWNSNAILGSQIALEDSGVGTTSTQLLNGEEVSVLYRSQNTNQDYFELIVQTSTSNVYLSHDYEVAAVEQPAGDRKETTITHLYGNYYIVQVSNLSSNWTKLVLALGFVDTTSTEKNVREINFDYYKQNVPRSDDTRPLTATEYVVKMTYFEEETIRAEIKESEKTIQQYRDTIADLKEQISQNETDIAYQVGEEKMATESVISRLNTQIQDTEKLISDEQTVIANYDERLTLIEQRRSDIEAEN